MDRVRVPNRRYWSEPGGWGSTTGIDCPRESGSDGLGVGVVSGDSVYLLEENHGVPNSRLVPGRDSGCADVNR